MKLNLIVCLFFAISSVQASSIETQAFTNKDMSCGCTNDISSGSGTGLQGPQGPQGPAGAPGITGATGVKGVTGSTGLPGALGNAGSTQATGPVGPAGFPGLIGPAGITGNTGAAGAGGTVGNQGVAGADGNAGARGATGATGSPGLQGPTGLQGSSGANSNITGPTGPTGVSVSVTNYATSNDFIVSGITPTPVDMPFNAFQIGPIFTFYLTGLGYVLPYDGVYKVTYTLNVVSTGGPQRIRAYLTFNSTFDPLLGAVIPGSSFGQEIFPVSTSDTVTNVFTVTTLIPYTLALPGNPPNTIRLWIAKDETLPGTVTVTSANGTSQPPPSGNLLFLLLDPS